jgi:hypothetical protein
MAGTGHFLPDGTVLHGNCWSANAQRQAEREASMAQHAGLEQIGRPIIMNCPSCASVLYEVTDGETSRFYCSEGHHFSLDEVCPGIEQSLMGLLHDVMAAAVKR